MKEVLGRLVKGEDLTVSESKKVFLEILDNKSTASQIGALLTAFRVKGETVEEITGAALALRERSLKVKAGNHNISVDRDEINVEDETILDTCGTGGDGTCTFNVSTATAFVVAGAGIKVAKHGYRAVSSLCGSADVLEELGVNIDITAADAEDCLNTIGITFLYGPLFNSTMKEVVSIRRELGFRTIFNLLGPLTNPANAKIQVLGVYQSDLTHKIAAVLKNLGSREAFVVCGEGTFDEISICGVTTIAHLKDGKIEHFELVPEDLGLKRAKLEEIRGGNARQNAEIIRQILRGEKGPKRDMVLMNAAAAFVAANLARDFKEGIEIGAQSIDSGKANEKLESLVRISQSFRPFIRREL